MHPMLAAWHCIQAKTAVVGMRPCGAPPCTGPFHPSAGDCPGWSLLVNRQEAGRVIVCALVWGGARRGARRRRRAAARRKERRRQAQVRTVQALVDKLKREQAVAAATHAYPAASCPVRPPWTLTPGYRAGAPLPIAGAGASTCGLLSLGRLLAGLCGTVGQPAGVCGTVGHPAGVCGTVGQPAGGMHAEGGQALPDP
jgi:hypothetical protein